MTTPVLDAIVATARRATGASGALLLVRVDESHMEVVSHDAPLVPPTVIAADSSYAGLVMTGEQPLAMRLAPTDQRARTEQTALGRRPTAICCVPCIAGSDVRGVLELIDKATGEAFGFDDVEVATMLAEVAAAAIDEPTTRRSPEPDVLAAMLGDLRSVDPARYERVADALALLLAGG